MNISRLACLGSIIAVLAGAVICAADEKPLFTFMQWSDVHVGNEINRPVHTRLNAAIKLANSLKPSFVIDSGDITTHPVYKANAKNLAEYDEYLGYVAALTMPIYQAPGNHDIGYFGYEGGKYEEACTKLVAAYRKKIGPLHQSFTMHGYRFILFNNNPRISGQPGSISDATFDWLESELKQNDKAFLFCHVQVLENGMGAPWGKAAERLVALCEKYNVVAVSYGHQHALHIKELGGTRYVMCPDLKADGRQEVFLYRIYSDRFELWLYDVFTFNAKNTEKGGVLQNCLCD